MLLIDDDEDLNQLFSKALSDQGFRVRSAMNAEDGLKLLRTAGHHSLIVVDSRLPEMTGAEFIRKKRGLDGPVAQVPVLLTSADRDLPMLARELGLSRYFQKPGNLTDFLRIVEESICGAA